jgi:hypothetical protein
MTEIPRNIGTTAKDFLTNAERRLGGVFTYAVFGVVAFALYLARTTILGMFDFGIALLGRTIALTVVGFIAVWLVTLAMNPRTWTELWHLQNRVARWVSRWAMKSDPFGRMRAFADEFLGGQFEKFNTASVRLEGQLQTVRQKLVKHTETLNASTQTVAAVRKKYLRPDGSWASDEYRDAFRLESQRITLTEETLKKLRVSEATLTTLVKIVDRWRNTFKFEIESTRMSAQFLEDQWNQANETAGALEAASSVFGHGDMAKADREVRDYIEKLTASRMAQADVLMKQLPELTALGDLKGDVAEDEIMSRLARLDNDSQRAFVEVQEDRRLIESGGSAQITEVVKQKAAVPARRYLSR